MNAGALNYPPKGVYDPDAVSSQSRSHAYAQGRQELVTAVSSWVLRRVEHPSFGWGVTSGGTEKEALGC